MPSDSVTFDRAAEIYDSTRGFPIGVERDAVQVFVQLGKLTQHSRILEVGIGTGRIALPLATFVGEYIGVDISRSMLGKLLAKRTTEHVDAIEADATLMPFAPASFDAIIAVHVFHLIPGWQRALREVARLLKPNGRLLHGWNGRDNPDTLDRAWREIMRGRSTVSGAVTFEQRDHFLSDEGWQKLGQAKHTYLSRRAPAEYLTNLRNRTWSHCWTLTDDELEMSVQRMSIHINENYADPSQLVEFENNFNVEMYAPPAY